MKFFKAVDLRSRKAMTEFLKEHFRYDTMNSWNCSTSYANNVKVHKLGLTAEQEDKLWKLIDTDEYYDELRCAMDDFAEAHDYAWQAGFNGRSGGYLVLYQGSKKYSEHLSFCPKCGQRNFKTALPGNDKCGVCGATRVNYINPPIETFTYPGRGTDDGEDFEDWSIEALRDRVKLVQEFDMLCDELLSITVDLLDNSDIEEEVAYAPSDRHTSCEKVRI